MRYVIKFTDGAFNRGEGFTCTLEEATVYGSYNEAEKVANELVDVLEIMPFELASVAEKEAVISFAQLAEAIEAATMEIEVCAPNINYYNNWEQKTISIIDPAVLLAQLRS